MRTIIENISENQANNIKYLNDNDYLKWNDTTQITTNEIVAGFSLIKDDEKYHLEHQINDFRISDIVWEPNMMEISRTYFGYNNEEELIEKIKDYIDEYTQWDYENDDFTNEGWPDWTFSGLPDGDKLTSFVREKISEKNISFDGEHDRIIQCKEWAERIAEEIELI